MKHTSEHIAKVAEANRGQKRSLATRQRMREAQLGKKRSDETKRRIAAALRARHATARDPARSE